LQRELGSIYQKNEEDIVTYTSRVKILRNQILEAYKISERDSRKVETGSRQ